MRGRAVALDSDVTTYLMQANTAGYDPARDCDMEVAPERKAAFLVFLHIERIVALPTVRRQVARIADTDLRALHQGFELIHLDEPRLDEATVAIRARELEQYHKGGPGEEEDCRIVAEAELAGADALLSFDEDLRKRLGPHARLRLLAPSEYWTALGITQGTRPPKEPDRSHPLYSSAWWRW